MNWLDDARTRDKQAVARLGNTKTDLFLRAEMDRRELLQEVDRLIAENQVYATREQELLELNKENEKTVHWILGGIKSALDDITSTNPNRHYVENKLRYICDRYKDRL